MHGPTGEGLARVWGFQELPGLHLQLTSQTTLQVQATVWLTLDFWSESHVSTAPTAPVSAAAVPFSSIPVLPRAAGLGPQIRTPPTLIRERQDVRHPAGQPCKPLAAEVKGRRKEQSHTGARGTWLRGPGGERYGFGRKEPGLGFAGKYDNQRAKAQLTAKASTLFENTRSTEGAPWINLPAHLLLPSRLRVP